MPSNIPLIRVDLQAEGQIPQFEVTEAAVPMEWNDPDYSGLGDADEPIQASRPRPYTCYDAYLGRYECCHFKKGSGCNL